MSGQSPHRSRRLPFNDIDVLRARSLRGRLAILKTDHTTVLQQLDSQLRAVARAQNSDWETAEQTERLARQQPKPKPKFDPVSGKWVVRNWDGTVAGAGTDPAVPRSFDTLQATAPAISSSTASTTRNDSVVATDLFASVVEPSTSTPWAVIQSVASDSPAQTAGLVEGDRILSFDLFFNLVCACFYNKDQVNYQ